MFTFDLELCPESQKWGHGQKAWVIWDKPAMYVRLTKALTHDASPNTGSILLSA